MAALLTLLALLASPGAAGTLDRASIKETQFPNGLRLVVREAHSTPLASVQIWIRAGGFTEDEQSSGMAHVVEHLVFKGTDDRGPGSIDAEVENLGGLLEATTDKDWTSFSCTVAGRYAARLLPVMAEAIRKPKFRVEDWEAERPVMLDEINRISLRPDLLVTKLLYSLAFKRHPYRFDVRGEPRFLNRLDLKAVTEYFQKHYTPDRMTIVVVGDVDGPAIEKVVRAAFAADVAKTKPADPLPPAEAPCATAERRAIDTPFANGYVGLAFPAPSVKNQPDVYCMDLILTMLELDGVGRLPAAVRDQADVSVSYETRRQDGLLVVVAGCGPRNADAVEARLRAELDFLVRQGVTEADLDVARRRLRGTYAIENESYSGQGGTLGYYSAIDSWEFAATYLERVAAVTAEQVSAVARKYLSADRCISVSLRPRAGGPTPVPRIGTL